MEKNTEEESKIMLIKRYPASKYKIVFLAEAEAIVLIFPK